MKKPVFLMLALVSCWLAAIGAGFVPVRNFGRDTYAGGSQNWAAIQDSIGRVYVGNRDGMLSFDGERWRIAHLSNYTTVRSMNFDKESGRIYAGGSEEFGFFEPDSVSGALRYISLLPAFGDRHPAFSEIWNIFMREGKVWFQSDYHLFCYDGTRIVTYPAQGRISKSAFIGGNILVALEDGTLTRLHNGSFSPLPGTEGLEGKKIMAILPLGDRGEILIATSVDGLYVYDGKAVVPLESDISEFLKDNQVFCAAANGNDYVFGTVNRGAVVKNFATGATHYINKESGMQNNTVLNASFDKSGNLWLCLDNGLDYAVYNTPVANLIGPSNAVGAGYASLLKDGRMYFGTNQGLYSSSYPFDATPSPLALRREIQGQIWSITDDGSTVFISGDAGLFELSAGSHVKVDGIPGTYTAWPLRNAPDRALASTYGHFHFLTRENGRWKDNGPVEGYDDIGGRFIQDNRGFIWLPHYRKGVYRLHFDPERKVFDECVLFDESDGLPSNHNNNATIYKGRMVFATPYGFYSYNHKTSRIEPDAELAEIFGPNTAGPITPLPDGALMVGESTGFNIARYGTDGKYNVTHTSFNALADKIIPGYLNLDYIGPNELIVSNQDGFWSIDTDYRSHDPWTPAPFIGAVYANRDSLVYRAAPSGTAGGTLRLPFTLNSLRFEFSCPDFRTPNSVEFSSYLENYDSDWSPYSHDATREYTRLAEGDYVLHVRAHDIQSDTVTETSLSVSIAPPWFRTVWAKAAYTVLALLLILGGYLFLRRWMRDARRQLEQRKEKELENLRRQAEQEALVKDYEIATLKSEQLEHDIKHKSQELSSTTMNLIRKNEILNDIASKIAKIQETPGIDSGVPGISRQLAKIQASIEENISHDDDWKTVTRNFDVVYENYTKRLMERHPTLTAADKRLCCYIKMGLSSKEIAPLINISYKSVEMARYRLRKKIDLPPETTLTDYLCNL